MPRRSSSSPMVSGAAMQIDLLADARGGRGDIRIMRHENLRYRGNFDAFGRDPLVVAPMPHPPDAAVTRFPQFARAGDVEFHGDLAAAEQALQLAAIRRRHRQTA